MTRIIGLIGAIASGKSIVADHLVAEKGAVILRFSDLLRDILKRCHIDLTRENLQKLGLALRDGFGDGVLANALAQEAKGSDAKIVVIDGIRYLDEFDMVKKLDAEIIYVTAPQRLRYERAIGRATRGEAGLSFEEFQENERVKTECLIDELGKKADHIIENTGSVDDLLQKVEAILR